MEEHEITGIILISMGGMLVLVLGAILLFRVSKKQLIRSFTEKEQLKEQHQLELLQAALNTQERERKRIAAELHDHIGSSLQTLKLYLHQIPLADPEEIEAQSTALLGDTIQDVKNLSHELMPASLEQLGLAEALRTLFGRLNAAQNIHCEFETAEMDRLEPDTELAIYRITQELTSNTLQHAKAQSIKVSLSINQSAFKLIYEDDGIGLTRQQKQKGLGLKTIESRCQVIGAELDFAAETSQGFKVVIHRNY